MKNLYLIINEQIKNFDKIFRLAKFEQKAMLQSHYLGRLWVYLSPAIQIIVYYIVFGLRTGTGSYTNSTTPYIYWMLMGMIPWFYISSSIIAGAASITSNLNLLIKTNFPISILPSISLVKGVNTFFTMLSLFLIYFIIGGDKPTIMWFQFGYYFIAMVFFLFTVSLLNASITVIFRDYQLIINSSMRLLLFLSGAVIDVTNHPESLTSQILKLNPFVYLIEGFRDTFFSRAWFFENIWWMVYFWSFSFALLVISAYVYNSYKDYFVEYM